MTEYNFPTEYQGFIALSRYARWLEKQKKRESWPETCQRYIDFMKPHASKMLNKVDKEFEKSMEDVYNHMLNLDVMPSMRAVMTAGPALERDHIAGYNCAFVAIDHPRAFDETMYILMCGTGVGFSVERQFVNKLPEVAEELFPTDTIIQVRDSRIGWAKAFRELISLLYTGHIPSWDVSKVRPSGARLKTFGGRSSGPEPLVDLFRFTIDTFKKAAGRKLTSIECHDLMCKIADIVVVGGVRRSAMISLSNVSDDRMRRAKTGNWWDTHGYRRLSNNSASYDKRPDYETFMDEFIAMYKSYSGERGIFSREASKKQAEKNGRRDPNYDFGTNPCSEIILRSGQFCNLSEVVIRPNDSIDELKRKVRVATIIGTIQSTLTNFRYLRKIWKDNCEEERLLGVSLTGIMDHKVLGDPYNKELPKILEELRQVAVDTNKHWAKRLGINQSTAITAVKPSGTVSQLVDSASGIHPRYSEYYIRTVRADKKDPLAQFMRDSGFPCEDDVANPSNLVFSFPMKSPDSSLTNKDITSMYQLDLWKIYQDHWCEHKPSMTCYYTNDNFFEVAQWVWKNFDSISGISFLPYDDHVYQQAPYQPCDEATFKTWLDKMPKEIDWDKLGQYEEDDNTAGSGTLACTGGVCEIVDLTK